MESPINRSRRQVIAGAVAALTAMSTAPLSRAADAPAAGGASTDQPFKLCLNTSTISGQNLGIAAEVDLAAKVGYHAIEPWTRELDDFRKKHGSLTDLRKRIDDAGLKVADAIGFAQWIVDDDSARAKGLEQAKHDMGMVAEIGGAHIAAPAAGENERSDLSLAKVAERYHDLLELGQKMGITPVLELWGHSRILSKLGQVAYVATEAKHENACLLLDIYHLYKGGNDFDSLSLLSGKRMPVLHTNDYPDKPERAKINDSFRVYPGDGIAPLSKIFKILQTISFDGYLSVELFNRSYWKQNPEKVAQAAIDKTRAAIKAAMSA